MLGKFLMQMKWFCFIRFPESTLAFKGGKCVVDKIAKQRSIVLICSQHALGQKFNYVLYCKISEPQMFF